MIHKIQSRTDPTRHYEVTVEDGDISCDCDGFLYRGKCAHAKFIHDKHYPSMPEGGQQKDGGAFWLARDRNTGDVKLTKNGDKYWTGSVTVNGVKMNATLFFKKPEQKTNDRQPDFSLLFSERQGGQEMDAVKERMKGVQQPQSPDDQEIRVEDIPF